MTFALGLIQNIAELTLAALVLLLICRRFGPGRGLLRPLAIGVCCALAATVCLLTPIEVAPGIIVDGRTGPLLAAGILGGPVSGVVCGILTALVRLHLGGQGAVPGAVGVALITMTGVTAHALIARHPALGQRLWIWLAAAAVASIAASTSLFILPLPAALSLWPRVAPLLLLASLGSAGVVWLVWHGEQVRMALLERLDSARADAERQSETAVRFVASMSHEIRTPLTTTLAAATALRDLCPGDAALRHVSQIEAASQALLRQIEDILSFAQLRDTAPILRPEPCRPGDVLREVAAPLAAQAQAKGLVLTLTVAPAAEAAVLLDPVRLAQVATNLIGNAVKFTTEGQITVDLACCPPPTDAPADGAATGAVRLRLRVRDTGIGMTAAELARVGAPFERARTSSAPGTGLGLWVSRRLVEAMGGSFTLHAVRHQGTDAVVEVPALRADPPRASTVPAQRTEGPAPATLPPAEPVATAAPPVTARHQAEVLIAEDVQINRELLGLMLDRVGVTWHGVASGADAVAAVASGHYRAVLMDLAMPGMDGLEAARRIRALERPAGDIPLVALTAHVTAAHRHASAEAGLNHFVAKPVDRAQLWRVLGEILGGPLSPVSPVPVPVPVPAPVPGQPASATPLEAEAKAQAAAEPDQDMAGLVDLAVLAQLAEVFMGDGLTAFVDQARHEILRHLADGAAQPDARPAVLHKIAVAAATVGLSALGSRISARPHGGLDDDAWTGLEAEATRSLAALSRSVAWLRGAADARDPAPARHHAM